jgi:hypothetical protein
MKNIHVLPTDKPSRFFNTNEGKYHFREHYVPDTIQTCKNHNIYITSDEEIKEGDWVITPTNDILEWAKAFQPIGKKIILTTDQKLIKYGVQPIDDEFLEWFVDNPSCEMVEVKEVRQRCHLSLRDWVDEDENGDFPMSIAGAFAYRRIYKIIIPQEEPTLEEEYLKDELKKYEGINVIVLNKPEEPKQETIEEAVERLIISPTLEDEKVFEVGAKWQAERMYSEEEVIDLLIKINSWPTTFEGKEDITEWFEQSKNKNNEN